jgi:hypothetical protein
VTTEGWNDYPGGAGVSSGRGGRGQGTNV